MKIFTKSFWFEVYLHLTDQWTEYQLMQYNKTLDARVEMLEGILVQAAWLYGNTRYIEKQLTTEEKELLADVLDEHVGKGSNDPPYVHERWWRNA